MLVRGNRGSSLNTATLASILGKVTGYRKKRRKMTIDTVQLKFRSSNFTGSYLMSFSFRPQQGQHTKYPLHSRCVSLVYLSCDLPVLPEGTKDYQVKDIWASINQLDSLGPHCTVFFDTPETPPSVILKSPLPPPNPPTPRPMSLP